MGKKSGRTGKKVGGLKGSLLSHQAKQQQQAAAALQLARQEQLKNKGKSKGKVKEGNFSLSGTKAVKPVQFNQFFIPFSSQDKMILVGEGDFSFSKSIVEAGRVDPENLISTCLDTIEDLEIKYDDSINENLEFLKERKVKVMYKIDATDLVGSLKLIKSKHLLKNKFKNTMILNDNKNLQIDYIMFNFPHLGERIKDIDRNIRQHQLLISGFFQSCKQFFDLLAENRAILRTTNNNIDNNIDNNNNNGIIITLFEGEPYDSWQIKKIAKNFNYKVTRSGVFKWELFPGYHHRRTNGTTKDTTKPADKRNARMYVFHQIDENNVKNVKKQKSDDIDNDSD